MQKLQLVILSFLLSFNTFGQQCFNAHHRGSYKKWHGQVNTLVNNYIKTFKIPGVVVIVGNSQQTHFQNSYGLKTDRPITKNSVDTIYDLASITKLFTATAIMQLIENKNIKLNDKVKRIFDEHFAVGKKSNITIEDLLRHHSGFKAGVTSDVFTDNSQTTWDNILDTYPSYPYKRFKYSDINYLILGKAIEELTHTELDVYIERNILAPLDMNHSFFRGYEYKVCKSDCAPTRRNRSVGHVHDPTSFKLSAVAGHAGLFSSAQDLAKFASIFMNNGQYCSKSILSEKSVKQMVTKKSKYSRGLGFDITSAYSNRPRGDYFAKGLSFGHTGFTGTSLWIDPTIDTFVIVLSNTVYAKDSKFAKKGYLRLIHEIANIVGEVYSI